MAAQNFRVIFTESAWSDLEEIVAYWADRGEPERGEQYAQDLPAEALKQLRRPEIKLSGRFSRHTPLPANAGNIDVQTILPDSLSRQGNGRYR